MLLGSSYYSFNESAQFNYADSFNTMVKIAITDHIPKSNGEIELKNRDIVAIFNKNNLKFK